MSLGFLQVLQARGLLQAADYISSVSGGGYASGYLIAAARVFTKDHKEIFAAEARKQLIQAGSYLAMGGGMLGFLRVLRLLGGVLSMSLVNLAWMLMLLAALGWGVEACFGPGCQVRILKMVCGFALLLPLLRVVVLGFITLCVKLVPQRGESHRGKGDTIWLSKTVNSIEGLGLAVLLAAILVFGVAPIALDAGAATWRLLLAALRHLGLGPLLDLQVWREEFVGQLRPWAVLGGGVAFGFLASADVIGVNAIFRDLVDAAYLRPKRRAGWSPLDLLPKNDVPLKDAVLPGLPYPLFGGGMYLRGEQSVPEQRHARARPTKSRPRRVVGTKVMDYFLMSPMYCGSETSLYARTTERPYLTTTLADAVSVSAASISPLWDGKQSPFVSWLLFALNMNLGVWVPNPKLIGTVSMARFLFRFWPITYLQLVVGKLTTERSLLHVADGGFVDNLGVIELLRRRCGVILVVDNTFDPEYQFKHLHNVVARAEVELEAGITFAAPVEENLRPSKVTGLAKQDHVLARITYSDGSEGYMVYVKACLSQPLPVDVLDPASEHAAAYATYHPQFPQESTADQFFDPDQWNAYNGLGRQLAESALGTALGGLQPGRDDLYQRLKGLWRTQQPERPVPRKLQPAEIVHSRLGKTYVRSRIG